jgi:hypothetical protein
MAFVRQYAVPFYAVPFEERQTLRTSWEGVEKDGSQSRILAIDGVPTGLSARCASQITLWRSLAFQRMPPMSQTDCSKPQGQRIIQLRLPCSWPNSPGRLRRRIFGSNSIESELGLCPASNVSRLPRPAVHYRLRWASIAARVSGPPPLRPNGRCASSAARSEPIQDHR